MLKSDIINHFGSPAKAARALHITQGAISQWGETIPEKQALRLGRMTTNNLNYDDKLYLQDSTEPLMRENQS